MSDQPDSSPKSSDPLEYWNNHWHENKTGWHINRVNPHLITYFDKLTTRSDGVNPKKVFIPLCGKTKDIGYFLEKGFQVFGVEAVRKAVEELAEENNYSLEFDESESLFSTADKRFQIYCGDIFNCPIEKWGPFDVIWDRAAFSVIEYQRRQEYVDLMRRSVQNHSSELNLEYNDFRYLLQGVRYDKKVFSGPPRSLDDSDLADLFSGWTGIEALGFGPHKSSHVRRCVLSGPCDYVIYLFTRKI